MPLVTGNFYNWGIVSNTTSGMGTITGLVGQTTNTTPQPYGTAFGVYGRAGNASVGWNFGVAGVLQGSNYGAGIYGSSYDGYTYIDEKYAGYFSGDVAVDGNLWAATIEFSDARLKSDISLINSRYAMDKIALFSPVKYKYKGNPVEFRTFGKDSVFYVYDSARYEREHLGLIAQDVKQVLPGIVHENADGYLGIDYTELIPLLIQGMKEQQKQIENLELQLTEIQNDGSKLKSLEEEGQFKSYNAEAVAGQEAKLYQNNPNPFDKNTTIKYYLPENTTSAKIILFDMQGKQLKSVVLNERGENSITIHSFELEPGMYMYSLIADNTEIDTKRMILTE
jgi:hypothetical protein